MTKPPTGEEDETTKPNRRAGRYNARRRHKRSKALEEILFGPSNESRLEVHRARLNRIQLTLYGSEYHAILNPDYAGPTTPRWAAFRLTGVIKPDQLERLEDRLRGLPLGHRSHIAAPSLRSSRARFVRKTKLKDRTLQKRKFIESYDEIFGRKARSLLSKLDPPIGRAMSQYHRRVSRLFTLKEERARKGYCRATKRYKKCHQYLKFRPCKVGTQAKMFRMGGMGTMMRVSSLRQETDWRIAEKDRSDFYTILSCLSHPAVLHFPELGYSLPMKPRDVVGLLAGVYVHIIDTPESVTDSKSTNKSVVITCRTARATQKELVTTGEFDHAPL